MVRLFTKALAIIAIVMVLVVVIAPAIDLPVTALRSLRFAQLALMLVALIARQLLLGQSRLRPFAAVSFDDRLATPNTPPVSQSPLRC